jgi:hypothetical protein
MKSLNEIYYQIEVSGLKGKFVSLDSLKQELQEELKRLEDLVFIVLQNKFNMKKTKKYREWETFNNGKIEQLKTILGVEK